MPDPIEQLGFASTLAWGARYATLSVFDPVFKPPTKEAYGIFGSTWL